jgi:DNA-binding transcriptional LysR family regulator
MVVASPAYLKRRGEPKTLEALAQHDALVHVGATGVMNAWRFNPGADEASIEVAGPLRSNSFYALLDAAVAGLGIAMLPDWVVGEAVASQRLRVILGKFEPLSLEVTALYRAELRAARRVKAFIDHLIGAYKSERR